MRILIYSLVAISFLASCSPQYPKKFRLPDELPEVSGLYHAGPDSLWWLNDGEHGPFLYLTDQRGQLLKTVEVTGAVNRDWEDLTADDRGNLYIGDFGNNFNNRRNLRIYVFHPGTGALDSILFDYPDQEAFPPPPQRANFDMEAFFWKRDSLHLFSKNLLHKGNYYTKHYVLPATSGQYTAELRDSLYLKKRVATAAAVSPNGQRVVILTYWFKALLGFIPLTPTTAFILEDFEGTNFLKGTMRRRKVPKCILPTQYESVDFLDERTLLIASEKTILFKQKARKIRLVGSSSGQ